MFKWHLQRDVTLPWKKIFLTELLGFALSATGGDFDNEIEQIVCQSFDGNTTVDDGAGIEIDDVGHAFGERSGSGNFHHGANRITGRSTQASGKHHYVGMGAGHGRGGFHVTARGTEKIKTRFRDLLWVIENINHWRGATLFSCSSGFDRISGETITDVAG